MPELSPSVARLRCFLEEADIPSGVLRRDPEGTTWLPAELRALVDADPTCHEELRRFVDREIELFGSVRQKSDALFTDRVLKAAAPVQIAGAGLDNRVRSWILAFAYALATGVAYLMLAPLLGLAALGTWTSQIVAATGLDGLDGGGVSGVGGTAGSSGAARAVAVLVGAAILVVAVAFMPSRRHTTPPA
jgi:hypothetical protein